MLRNPVAHQRRAVALMLSLLLLAVLLIVLVGHWFLQDARQRLLHEIGQEMRVKASNQAALLTVWHGTHRAYVQHFLQQDIVRLFAVQAEASSLPASTMLAMAQQGRMEAEEETPQPLDDLAHRLPLMLQLLQNFMQGHEISAAWLANTRLEVCLAPADLPMPDSKQQAALQQARDTGRVVMLPVRRVAETMLMDVACPVFAPLYVDKSGNRVAALLLYSLDVTEVIRAAGGLNANSPTASAILENHGDSLCLLDAHGSLSLPGWHLHDGTLPLNLRPLPLPDGQAGPRHVHALAQPVPDMPWLVMQSMDEAAVMQAQEKLYHNVVLAGCLCTALTAIVLLALWWWLVARRERAVTGQIRHLYQLLQQQKHIMDKLNACLSEGIVLNDLNGVIYYANESYARMAGLAVRDMRGLPCSQLTDALEQSLVKRTAAVHQQRAAAIFHERLVVAGQERCYMGSSTPFLDANGALVGVVSVYSDISDMVAARQRAEEMVDKTVEVLVRAIETVDPYLGGQSNFTARLAQLLAEEMGQAHQENRHILRTAARLSQIGMIRLPRELLTKAGSLTEDERRQLQSHVAYARDALSGIDFGLPVLEAITQMYERMDGSGYPDGLRGESICEPARFLAVANTFCALVRPRSWRSAFSVEQALNILAEEAGRYDPAILQALRKLLPSPQGQEFLADLQRRRISPSDARKAGNEPHDAKNS